MGTTVRYISTRGAWADDSQPFCSILQQGLAPDGGLAVPQSYPRFTPAELNALRPLGYRELAFAILSRLIDESDIPTADLKAIIDKTYRADVYCYTRDNQNAEDITPTLKLEDNLYLLSLKSKT